MNPSLRTLITVAFFGTILPGSLLPGAIIYSDFTDINLHDPDWFLANDAGTIGTVSFNPTTLVISAGYGEIAPNTVRFNAVEFNSMIGRIVAASVGLTGTARTTSSPLGVGTTIGASLFSNPFPQFRPDSTLQNAYLGARFDAGGGNYHYGWVRFSTGDPDSFLGPTHIAILDAAFESTANQSILAGAVPEPSIPLLISLIGGASFLYRRRRGN